ncbi:uncharacterized protein K02A2.6-like [Corticium candelabrum]|uniref:uncharacterized protein K02A2.6-like n=1 Tax=Corticium candelabrum TaxID=121492 RepID=UPI002E25BD0C|nr:uncharacterized protein K02A2.6-like [Corticium candelabrum]
MAKGSWLELQVDIFGELVIQPRDHRFLIVVHDLYSKWPEIRSTAQVRASDVISFMEDLFVRWGLLVSITTDNGPQFRSHEFKQWLKGHGVRHVTIPLYHPQGNAGVERLNQVIKQVLKAQLAGEKSMVDALRYILFHYRTTPHSVTGKSPAEQMVGRKLRQPLSQLLPPYWKEDSGAESTNRQIRNKEQARKVEQRQQQTKQYKDHRRRAQPSHFQPGTWVRVKRPVQGHKLRGILSMPL